MSKKITIILILLIVTLSSSFFIYINHTPSDVTMTPYEEYVEDIDNYDYVLTQTQSEYLEHLPSNYVIKLGALSGFEDYDKNIYELITLPLKKATNLNVDIIYKETLDELDLALTKDEIDIVPFYSSKYKEQENTISTSKIFSNKWYLAFNNNNDVLGGSRYLSKNEIIDFINSKDNIAINFNSIGIFDEIKSKLGCLNNCITSIDISNFDKDTIKKELLVNENFDFVITQDIFELKDIYDSNIQFIDLDELVDDSTSSLHVKDDNYILSTIFENYMIEANLTLAFDELFTEFRYNFINSLATKSITNLESILIDKINNLGGIDFKGNDKILYDPNNDNSSYIESVINNISNSTGINLNYNNSSYVNITNNYDADYSQTYHTNNYIDDYFIGLTNSNLYSSSNTSCSLFRNYSLATYNNYGKNSIESLSPTNNILSYNNLDNLYNDIGGGKFEFIILSNKIFNHYSNTNNITTLNKVCTFEQRFQSNFNLNFDEENSLSDNEKELLVDLINKFLPTINTNRLAKEWSGENIRLDVINKELSRATLQRNISIFSLITLIIIILIVFYTRYKKKYINKDYLTKLNNRSVFNSLLNNINSNEILAFIDINDFKKTNDQYGHHYGDLTLIELAKSLKQCFSVNEIFRLSGDEFLILSNKYTLEQFQNKLKSLIEILKHPKNTNIPVDSRIMISVGLTNPSITDGLSVSRLFEIGDYLMYLSKGNLESKVTTLNANSFHDLNIDNIISNEFLENSYNNIIPYFQPIYQTTTKKVVGFEVLARLKIDNHIYNAGTFIKHISDTIKFDINIMNRAIKKFNTFKKDNQFLTINIFDKSISAFSKLDIKADGDIFIEILEDVILSDDEIANLKTLSNKGFKIVIDDFGAKEASITRLYHDFIYLLKIDKLLLHQDNNQSDILNFISKLSQSLNIKTLVEGVENNKQLSICKNCNIDYLQGYLLSKPLSYEDVILKLYED